MEIGKGVRDLSQGPKNVYFVDTARKSLLECSYFLCLSKECKDYNYLIAIILCGSLAMQIFFILLPRVMKLYKWSIILEFESPVEDKYF